MKLYAIKTGAPSSGGELSERAVLAIYCLLAALLLWLIWSVRIPAMVDYLNHLARLYVLAHFPVNGYLQQNYQIQWEFHPYILSDLLFTPLVKRLDIFDVGRIYLSLTLLVLLAGIVLLRKAISGRIDILPIIACSFLFGSCFFWGFLNYLFATGLTLLTFAAWIFTRQLSFLPRALLFSIVGFLLLMTHPFAPGMLAILLATYEFGRYLLSDPTDGFSIRQAAISLSVVFLPSFLAIGFWIRKTGEASEAPGGFPRDLSFGGWQDRLSAFYSPVIYDGSDYDRIWRLVFFLVVAVILLCYFYLKKIRKKGIPWRIHPNMKLTVLAVFALSLLLPQWLFGTNYVHVRLPMVAWILLAVGLDVSSLPRRFHFALLWVGLALLLTRIGLVEKTWEKSQPLYEEMAQAGNRIPAGIRLLPVQDMDWSAKPDSPGIHPTLLWHADCLYVISRQVFLPTLFTHTVLRAQAANRYIDTPVGDPVHIHVLMDALTHPLENVPFERYFRVYWAHWPDRFDYLFLISDRRSVPLLPDLLDLKAKGSFFELYEIRKPIPDGLPG